MILAQRSAMVGSGLPYDSEVGWLESRTTQWINIGVTVTSSVGLSCRALSTGYISGGYMTALFGNRSGDGVNDGTCIGRVTSNFFSAHGPTTAWQPRSTSTNVWADIEFTDSTSSGRTFSFNGTAYSNTNANSNWPKAAGFALFAGGSNGGNVGKWRIAFAKVIADSILVRDYIPVRVGSVGYLYDRANPTGGPLGNGLYGSATATPLIAGPDK